MSATVPHVLPEVEALHAHDRKATELRHRILDLQQELAEHNLRRPDLQREARLAVARRREATGERPEAADPPR